MRFQCSEHGEMDKFFMSGYQIAHSSHVKASPRDFEGITFIVENPDGEEVSEDDIDTKEGSTKEYLKKFAGWRGDIVELVKSNYERGDGFETFVCPDREERQCITNIVDEVFDHSLGNGVDITARVKDECLYVDTVQDFGEGTYEEFVGEIVSVGEKIGSVDRIHMDISHRQLDYPVKLERPLENYGFDVKEVEIGDFERFEADLLL